MKLLGCCIIAAVCSAGGMLAAGRLSQRVNQLRLLVQLLNDMMNQLRYTLPTVGDMLQSLATQPCYQTLAFLTYAADALSHEPFPHSWQTALHENPLPREEQAILLQVGSTLGSTDLDGQLSALSLCREQLQNLLQRAETRQQSHSTLYRSMGLLTGLFLVILLI